METMVEYNFLGRSGMKVSNIGLGTMTFGTEKSFFPGLTSQASEEKAFEIMDKYVEFGGNFLDTADVYSLGQTETIVGNWLQSVPGKDRKRVRVIFRGSPSLINFISTDTRTGRDNMVVGTKVRGTFDGSDVNSVGLSRRHITASCEQSLRRLQTHYIDVYMPHIWDSATPIEETLRTFDDLIRCGKVRYFGCSNVCGWQMQTIVEKIEHMGLNRCICLQQQYNLLTRQSELEEFMVCKNEGIGVVTWSPLKGGLLTGKYRRNSPDGGINTRLGYLQTTGKFFNSSPDWKLFADKESHLTLMDTLSTVATKHDKTIPQVAIRWLLQKDIVASVLVGATSVKQLEENMGAAKGWLLSDDEMAQLDEAGTLVNIYPHEMVYRVNKDRCNPFIK